MWDWSNKIASTGIEYSRYIASWLNVGGQKEKLVRLYDTQFYNWLLTTGLEEIEAKEIANMWTNGKLELQESAKAFLKKSNK
jgi:hypothetical protein